MLPGMQPGVTFAADKLRVQTVFPTPVVVAPLQDADGLNEALAQIILDHEAADAGVVRSNSGGWQSQDDFAAWSGEPGAQLLHAAGLLASHFTRIQGEAGLTSQSPAWRVNAWANVSVAGDANHAHHHPASFWSGVYWVACGQEAEGDRGGAFEILDPRGILPAFYAPSLRYAVAGCLSAGLSDFIMPAAGTMILFPSWLVHAVRPYRGAGRRISVAFNFSV